MIPESFLLQRDSSKGQNAKGSVGTDFLTVQQAPYGNTNGDGDLRLMTTMTLMTVVRVMRMRKASASVYGMLTLYLALCSVLDVQQLVESSWQLHETGTIFPILQRRQRRLREVQ